MTLDSVHIHRLHSLTMENRYTNCKRNNLESTAQGQTKGWKSNTPCVWSKNTEWRGYIPKASNKNTHSFCEYPRTLQEMTEN